MSKGVRYMVLATILFSVVQVLVKYLDNYPFFELIFFRSIVSLVISVIVIKKGKISLLGNNKLFLILRGLFGTVSLCCFFYSIKHAPIGTVVTIVNIKPFLILIVAFFVLGEKFKLIQILFFFISFIGIVIINNFDNSIGVLPIVTTILAAFFASIIVSFIKLQ